MYGHNNSRFKTPTSNRGQHSNNPFFYDYSQPRHNFYGQANFSAPQHNYGQVSGYSRPPIRDRHNNPPRHQNTNQRHHDKNNQAVQEDCKSYVCPSCSHHFEFQGRHSRHPGRLPLVLNCQHTICQECISNAIHSSSVICPLCQKPSELPKKQLFDNLQEVFVPNFYILGRIMWSKSQGSNVKQISLVPTHTTLKNRTLLSDSEGEPPEPEGEKCCFLSCHKRAVLRCQDCNDVYCTECCTVVHKSAKSLWSHVQVQITNGNFSAELEKCVEHGGMDIEFYCTTCDTGTCCYCFIEKHEGHEKEYLSKLNTDELNEFQMYKKKAEVVLKQLIVSQKKLKNLSSGGTSSLEKEISGYFANLHARLYFAEKKLLQQVTGLQGNSQHDNNFTDLGSRLDNSIKTWKNILAATENSNFKKLNLRSILQKLREVETTPCYLLTELADNVSDLTEFFPDPLLEDLDGLFSIKKSLSNKIKLLSKDELPPDYVPEPLDQQEDCDASSTVTSLLHSSKKEVSNQYNKKLCSQSGSKNRRKTLDKKFMADNEMVEVTHIESLECFYVQLKKQQSMFIQMTKDIENFVKVGGTAVDSPQIDELYLAMYVSKTEKMWCRGRVTEIRGQEADRLYEVYFIDFGNTQLLNKNKLREITPHLTHKKPFAIQCSLYNPTHASWNKNAHVYMGKIINGKQLYMVVKGVNNGVHTVDLMVCSSDRGLTSIIDILIHTCTNALSSSSDSLNSVQRKVLYNPELKIFSNSFQFHKNQVEKILLANVVDPHHIFVHIAGYSDLFKTLMSDMKHFYKKKAPESFIPVEDTFVVVEHRDPIRGAWHRAFIKKVDLLADKAHVLLVDWGVNVTVPLANIRMLTENFIKLESQAILVRLAHVEPYQGKVWSERATFFLQKNFRTQEPLRMIVYCVDNLEVALFETLGSFSYCINAQLVQEKLADSTGKISQTVEWPDGDAEELSLLEDEEFVAGLLKKVDESNDEDSQEEQDKANKYVKQQIVVVRVDRPDAIYIKFVGLEREEQDLHKELQIHYNKEKTEKESWEKDELCVVQLPEYYARGKILRRAGDEYEVNLYDLAEERTVSGDKLFVYYEYFKKYPKFVYLCHLTDIKPAGGDKWSLSSTEALEGTFRKHKNIFVTKVGGDVENTSIPVLMWYTQVKLGGALEPNVTKFISVNKLLVKLGFAYKVKDRNTPSVGDLQTADEDDTESEILDTSNEVTTSAIVHKPSDDLNDSTESKESGNEMIAGKSTEVISTKGSSSDWNDLVEEEQNASKSNQDSPYHTRETEITDWKPAFPIKKREFNAWITCAETEGILYLRDEELQLVYKDMEANLKQYFDSQPKKSKKQTDWQPGQICTISYKDYWYRGKILKVDSPNEIVALMIDFGSDHTLSPDQLYREILYPEIPAFASKVKLDRVYARTGDWISSDYDTLMDVVTEFAKVVIKGSLDVELPLAEVYNDKGKSINEILVKMCPNLTRYLTEEEGSDEDLALIEEEDTLGPELMNQIDTTSMKFKVEPLPEEGFKDKVLMHVVGVLSYNRVVLKKMEEDLDALLALNLDIQQSYVTQPDLEDIQVGIPCICPYAEDGMWYRALVHNIEGIDCGYVFVFFVDFGNLESVSVGNVKMMKPDWFNLPVSCYLADVNVEVKTDNHLEHILQHMKKLFTKNKYVHFVSEDPLVVDLFEKSGELCYEPLIKNGLLRVK